MEKKYFNGNAIIAKTLVELVDKEIYEVKSDLICLLIYQLEERLKTDEEEIIFKMSTDIIDSLIEDNYLFESEEGDISKGVGQTIKLNEFAIEEITEGGKDEFKDKILKKYFNELPEYIKIQVDRFFKEKELRMDVNNHIVGVDVEYLYSAQLWGSAIENDKTEYVKNHSLNNGIYIFEDIKARDLFCAILGSNIRDNAICSKNEGYLVMLSGISIRNIYDREKEKYYTIRDVFVMNASMEGIEYLVLEGNWSCNCSISTAIRVQCDSEFPELECSSDRLEIHDVNIRYEKTTSICNKVYSAYTDKQPTTIKELVEYYKVNASQMLIDKHKYNNLYNLESDNIVLITNSNKDVIIIDSLGGIVEAPGESFELRVLKPKKEKMFKIEKEKPDQNWKKDNKFYSKVSGRKK